MRPEEGRSNLVKAGIPRRGSVLVVALWTLLGLAMLAVAVGAMVSSNLQMATALRNRLDTYWLTRSGVEAAIAWLDASSNAPVASGMPSGEPGLHRGAGLFDSAAMETGSFTIFYLQRGHDGVVSNVPGLAGMAGRINVNFCTNAFGRELFRALIETAGDIKHDRAVEISQAVSDWIDADETPMEFGVESGYYRSLPVPYGCHNGPMSSVRELLLVKGVTTNLYEAIESLITVYGTDGKIDLNSAPYEVLLAAGAARNDADKSLCRSFAERILKSRGTGGPYVSLAKTDLRDRLFGSGVLEGSDQDEWLILEWLINYRGISVQSRYFCGICRGLLAGSRGGGTREIRFVYDRQDRRIRSWNESR